MRGGTRVTFWGVNFGGGSVYKCRFRDKVVNATYHAGKMDHPNPNEEDTITCMSPPFSETGAKGLDSVDVSVIIFAADEDADARVHHHSASHRRKWLYYATDRRSGGLEFGHENKSITYAQIFPSVVAPLSGPIAGGTTVRIPGRYLLDHADGYNCRFGGTVVPAVAEHVLSSPHTVRVDEVVFCVSPPLGAGDGTTNARTVTFQVEHASVEKDKTNGRIGPKMAFRYYKSPNFFGDGSENIVAADVSSKKLSSSSTSSPPVRNLTAVSPTKGPSEGGQVLIVREAGANGAGTGSSALLGGTAEKYICRFGGQVTSTGFYDHGIRAVKCLVPPASALPLYADEESDRLQGLRPSKGRRWQPREGNENTRGDIYFGDNIWGRSRASMLFLELRKSKRLDNRETANDDESSSILLPQPKVCWGESPCDARRLAFASSAEGDVDSMLREARTVDASERRRTEGGSHMCSDTLDDGEQLVSNIYARLQSRKLQQPYSSSSSSSSTSYPNRCARAVRDMESAILGAASIVSPDRFSAEGRGFDSPYSRVFDRDLNSANQHHMKYFACRLPPVLRAIQGLSCTAIRMAESDVSQSEIKRW
jgi:hypothetical protein